MTRPNIFQLATSELSQDAIIAWIALWSDKKHRESNPRMAACGDALIKSLIGLTSNRKELVIEEVQVKLQWKSIDLIIEVNKKHIIVIEDKTGSGEHSDQLNRYWKIIETASEYQNHEKTFVYLKTYNQCKTELDEIEKGKTWSIMMRPDLKEILKPHLGSHTILDDFLDHLAHIDKLYHFEDKPLKAFKEEGTYWIGLYEALLNLDPKIGIRWHRVNNVNGGFWNLLLTWQSGKKNDVLYLQLEEHFLHVKLKISETPAGIDLDINEYRKMKVLTYRNLIVSHPLKPMGLEQTRYKVGEYMTLARLDITEYLGGDDAIVQINKVESLLRGFINWIEQVNLERESDLNQ